MLEHCRRDPRQEHDLAEVRKRQSPLGVAARRVEGGRLGQHLLERLELPRGCRRDPLGERSRGEPAGDPHVQRIVEGFAQSRQRVAGGRLAQRQHPASVGHRAAAVDRHQHAKQIQVEPVESLAHCPSGIRSINVRYQPNPFD